MDRIQLATEIIFLVLLLHHLSEYNIPYLELVIV